MKLLKIYLTSLFLVLLAGLAYAAENMAVLDITATFYENEPAIAVVFDRPISPRFSYDDFIAIAEGNKIHRIKGILDKSKYIIYYRGLESGKTYHISVWQGMKSEEGLSLAKDVEKNITMNPLKSLAGFAGKGVLMVPTEKALLPVNVVNLDTILVNFYRAPLDDGLTWIDRLRYRRTYSYDFRYWKDRDLVASKAYGVNALNKQATVNIEPPKELFAAPGVYIAVIQNSWDFENMPAMAFLVSDLGIQLRRYGDRWVAQARSIKTGAPLSNVEIAYHTSDKKVLQKVYTANNGMASTKLTSSISYITASLDGQLAFLNDYEALDLSEYPVTGESHSNFQTFIYGPRDLYRGGETVKYNILVRDGDGRLVNPGKASLELMDARGQKAQTLSFTPSENLGLGYYEYSYDLDPSAATGTWRLNVTVNGKTTTHSFSVEDFLPETMRLTLGNLTDPAVVDAKTASRLNVLGEYLYGASASGSRVDGSYNILSAAAFSEMPGFVFAPDSKSLREGSLDEIELDGNGKGSWNIAQYVTGVLKERSSLAPIKIRYYASLYASGGRAVNRAKEYIIFPTGEAVGIKPAFKGSNAATGENSFTVTNINSKLAVAPAKIDVSILKEDRNYYWDYSESNGWRYWHTSLFYPVYSSQVDITNAPKEIKANLESGAYKIIAKNAATGETAAYHFYVGGWYWDDDYYDGGASYAKPESLTITLDKSGYGIGDTAKVKITSPYDGKGKIMLETAEGSLWSQDITVKNKSAEVSVPVTTELSRHDIYLSAYIHRAYSEVVETQKSMVLGIAYFPLERKARRIELTVTHPDKAEPGKEFEVVIKAKNASQVQDAVVTLAAVDEGVLAVKRFITPDAFKYFFRKLGYGVELYDNFQNIINRFDGKLAARYGGDAEMMMKEMAARGGALARSEVKIISYFTKPLQFKNGEARVKLNIDSFNGELRLMALAFSKDSYGSTESSMKIAEPIITELSLPRFLATGDSTELTLDLTNMTESVQNLTITAAATAPLKLASTVNTQLAANKGQKYVIKVPVIASGANGTSVITVNVAGYKGGAIKKTWRLQVRPPYPAVTKSGIFTLKPKEMVKVFAESLNNYVEGSAILDISVSNTPPVGLGVHFQHLLTYPYGCLEQTTSSTFPLLYATDSVRQRYNLQLPEGKTRQELVDYGIRRLLSKQLSSGGFGYWDSTSSESPWGTVYAAEFLSEAQALGFAVNPQARSQLNSRLTTYVRGSVNSSLSSYYDSGYSDMPTRAYAAYVLAKSKAVSLSDVRSLADRYLNSNARLTDISLYHLSYALKSAGDPKKAEELYKKADTARRDVYDYYGDYASPVRDGAWGLALQKEYDEKFDLPKAFFSFYEKLSRTGWLSTQDRIRVLKLALLLDSDEPLNFTLTAGADKSVNGKGVYGESITADRLKSGVSVRSANTGNIYIKTDFVAYPSKVPAPFSDNASVERRYFSLAGDRINSLSSVKSGEYVLVGLAVRSRYNTADGLVVDMIPAGFELENQNLENSMKLPDLRMIGSNSSGILYKEYRDDRFVAALTLSRDSERRVFYIMRAVTPGAYINPPPYFEDMYRGNIRALGSAVAERVTVTK